MVADSESKAPSAWADVHARLRSDDITRRQYLDEMCAAEDAAREVRSLVWRAQQERLKREKLRRAETQG
jgi:hypothetical protein